MAITYAPKPESTTSRENVVPVWRDVLDQLLDRSGMWFTGDGGSSGPKPELAENESHSDDA